jgi:hypothetical protein
MCPAANAGPPLSPDTKPTGVRHLCKNVQKAITTPIPEGHYPHAKIASAKSKKNLVNLVDLDLLRQDLVGLNKTWPIWLTCNQVG